LFLKPLKKLKRKENGERKKKLKREAETEVATTKEKVETSDKKKKEKEKVKCFVVDAKGDTIRTFTRKIKEKGLVRIGWDMRTDGIRMPSRKDAKPDEDLPRGLNALPGKYTIIAQYGDHTDKATVEVKLDPRVKDITAKDIQDLTVAFDQLNQQVTEATTTFDKLKKAKKRVALVDKLSETLQDSLKVDLKAMRARRYLATSYGKPTPNAQVAIDKAEKALSDARTKIDAYFSEEWPGYQKEVEALTFDLFDLE